MIILHPAYCNKFLCIIATAKFRHDLLYAFSKQGCALMMYKIDFAKNT